MLLKAGATGDQRRFGDYSDDFTINRLSLDHSEWGRRRVDHGISKLSSLHNTHRANLVRRHGRLEAMRRLVAGGLPVATDTLVIDVGRVCATTHDH
jgi:hypothetical protein